MKKTLLAITLAFMVTRVFAGFFEEGNDAYRNGDYASALGKYKLAAAQGDARAQFNLGIMYYSGRGVAQNYLRAHMWSNLAAISGDKNAASNRDIIASKMNSQQVEQA